MMFNPDSQYMQKRRAKQAACPHERVLEDRFSKLPGVHRATKGDVCCADCGAQLEMVWNCGKPQPIRIVK